MSIVMTETRLVKVGEEETAVSSFDRKGGHKNEGCSSTTRFEQRKLIFEIETM